MQKERPKQDKRKNPNAKKENGISSSMNQTQSIKRESLREKKMQKRKQTFSKNLLLFPQNETALLEFRFDFRFHSESGSFQLSESKKIETEIGERERERERDRGCTKENKP